MKHPLCISIFGGLLLALAVACNSVPADKQKGTTSTETPSTTSTEAASSTSTLPSIPYEEVKNLFDNCDYIDYLFYKTNFSISQNEKASIQAAVSHIAQTTPTLRSDCKPIGRIFYQIDAVNVWEADMYFQEDCTYLVFLKDNKPVYANMMTPDGIAYFNNIFNQVKTMGNSGQ